MKNKFLKNCLALFLITLIAGVSLAVVNEITKEPIAQAENNAKLAAYNEVFVDVQFEEIADSAEILKANAGKVSPAAVEEVLLAKDKDGNTAGYVMSAVSPNGYGGDIKVAVGISSKDDTISGISILSNNETAGLGSKCTDDEFKSQFKGKSAKGIQFTKTGASTDSEIDAISGATITTNAVTQAVNAALEVYNNSLKEG